MNRRESLGAIAGLVLLAAGCTPEKPAEPTPKPQLERIAEQESPNLVKFNEFYGQGRTAYRTSPSTADIRRQGIDSFDNAIDLALDTDGNYNPNSGIPLERVIDAKYSASSLLSEIDSTDGRYDKAIQSYQETLDMIEQAKVRENLKDNIYLELASMFFQNNEQQKAYTAYVNAFFANTENRVPVERIVETTGWRDIAKLAKTDMDTRSEFITPLKAALTLYLLDLDPVTDKYQYERVNKICDALVQNK